MRSVPRLTLTLASGCTLALSMVFAAPPPAISGLIGEWSGESSRSQAGEPATLPFADARRYWVDGDAVRGEILVGSGNGLQTVRVAIVPRPGHFLKTVTAEDGRSDLLIGVPAENGVLWTPLSGDKNRFIERVAGDQGNRRLELLVPEGDSAASGWRVSEALQAATGAMSGVVGGGVAGPETAAPFRLPPESELVLIDRVAELLIQRAAARGDAAKLARELAAAWREGEIAGARVKVVESELAELTATSAPQASDETPARVEAAEKDAVEARRWADELEKSLRNAMAKAEDATMRVAALDAELAAAKSGAQRAADERAVIAAELETRARETEARGARVAELEANMHDLQEKLAAAGVAVAEAGRASQTVTRVAEVERALNSVRTELEAVTAAREQAVRESAAVTAAKAHLEEQVATLMTELATANTRRVETEEQLAAAQVRLATAEQQQREAESRLAAVAGVGARVAELEQALQTATAVVAQRESELTGTRQEHAAERDRRLQLEQQLAAEQSDSAVASDSAARLAATGQELRVAREQLAAAASQDAQSEQDLRAVVDARKLAEEQFATAVGERDVARARVATLETQIETWAQQAPPAAEDHSARVAALEQELEGVRGQLTAASTQGGAMESRLRVAADAQARAENELTEARRTIAEDHQRALALEGQLADARQAAAPDAADSARRAGLESELAAARAEVALAQTRRADLERELALARAATESAARLGQQSDADLSAARTRLAELENELAAERARVASTGRDRPRGLPEPTTDARIADLETRLSATFARAQQRQDEVDRLTARVRELEAHAPAAAVVPSFTLTIPPVVPAGDTAARERRLADADEAQQRTLAQRNRELAERARAASVPPVRPAPRAEIGAATPVAPVVDAAIGFRLPSPAAPRSSATRLPPTRPSDNRVFVIPTGATGGNPALATTVGGLAVNGYRRAGVNSVVIIGGRPYKPGDLIDAGRGLRFTRIDSDAIVFTGPAGAEYRFQL